MLHIETIHVPPKPEVRYNWEYMAGSYDLQDSGDDTAESIGYDNSSVTDDMMEDIVDDNDRPRHIINPTDTNSRIGVGGEQMDTRVDSRSTKAPYTTQIQTNESLLRTSMHSKLFDTQRDKDREANENFPPFPLSNYQYDDKITRSAKTTWVNRNPTREIYKHKHIDVGKAAVIRKDRNNSDSVPKKKPMSFNVLQNCVSGSIGHLRVDPYVHNSFLINNMSSDAIYQMLFRTDKKQIEKKQMINRNVFAFSSAYHMFTDHDVEIGSAISDTTTKYVRNIYTKHLKYSRKKRCMRYGGYKKDMRRIKRRYSGRYN